MEYQFPADKIHLRVVRYEGGEVDCGLSQEATIAEAQKALFDDDQTVLDVVTYEASASDKERQAGIRVITSQLNVGGFENDTFAFNLNELLDRAFQLGRKHPLLSSPDTSPST